MKNKKSVNPHAAPKKKRELKINTMFLCFAFR
jgi:hypothetical protein